MYIYVYIYICDRIWEFIHPILTIWRYIKITENSTQNSTQRNSRSTIPESFKSIWHC